MASDLCLSLTKYFMFLFNLIFFLLGSTLLALGLWIMFSESSALISVHSYTSLSLFHYLLVVCGSVTLSLGFFGCLGALKEIKCMLAIYFLLLTILLAGQIIGGVLLITQKSAFKSSIEENVIQIIRSFGNNDSSLQDFQRTLLIVQHKAHCCGWKSKEDWGNNIPCSCYLFGNITADITSFSSDVPCTKFENLTSTIHSEGCQEVITDWVDKHILMILIVVFVIAAVECLQWVCLVTFCCLNRMCRRCHPRKSHGSHIQLSREFTEEYWPDMWYDPFDVSV